MRISRSYEVPLCGIDAEILLGGALNSLQKQVCGFVQYRSKPGDSNSEVGFDFYFLSQC